MKKRNVLLGSVALLAVLLVVGGTMAWFTAQADPVVNTFIAGTVDIELHDETIDPDSEEMVPFPTGGFDNVNPGDEFVKHVYVENTGSKRVFVRVKLDPLFIPEDLDLDVVGYDILNGWVLHTDGWYYYPQEVMPGESTPTIIEFVEFAGAEMGNEYQGATFELTVEAEAIQVTNGAALDAWGVDPLELGL